MSGERPIDRLYDRYVETGTTLPPTAPLTLPPLVVPKRKRPLLLEADVPDMLPAPDSNQYHAALERLAHERKKGDPLAPSIKAVGRAIYYGWRVGIRQTIAQIASRAGVCSQTTQNCIAYLEPSGIFAPINVMVRVDGALRRAANLYLPCHFMLPALRMARRVADRVLGFYEECSKKLGLHWRTFGFNTTPLRQPGET